MNLNFFQWMPRAKNSSNPDSSTDASSSLATLVFLHGMGGTGNIWRPIAAQLEDEYHCIAPDQRGHGDSRAIPLEETDQFHAEDYARDVAHLLTQLDEKSYFLVGHSMGVRTALALAHQNLSSVKGLIAVDIGISREWGGGIGPNLSKFLEALPESFSSRRVLRDYLMQHCPDPSIALYLTAVAKPVSNTSIEEWRLPFDHLSLVKTIEQANQAPLGKWLQEILNAGIPVLYLRGEKSLVWKKEDYEAQKKQYAHPLLQFEEWAGCGHGLPFEKRAEFVERVKRFVGEVINYFGSKTL